VDPSEVVSVVALLGAAVTLGCASYLDIRTRRVPNRFWILLSLLGIVLILLRIVIDGERPEFALILVPIAAILSDVYLDSEGNSILARSAPVIKYALALITVLALGILWGEDSYFQYLLAVPVMMMVFVLMYVLDVIKGGADAKALIALAILFPVAPAFGGLPMAAPADPVANVVFPFAFAVLIDAAILVVFLPLGFLVRNVAARDIKFPQMFLGYRIDSDTDAPGFVWLMERIENGRHVTHSRPRGEEDFAEELRRLRERGISRVWVTPKIPFIAPIFAGLLLATVVGNIMFLLFGF
jgi:preflagellin peptidase FlaK